MAGRQIDPSATACNPSKRTERTPTPEKPSALSNMAVPKKHPTTKADATPDKVRKEHAGREEEMFRRKAQADDLQANPLAIIAVQDKAASGEPS